MYRDRRTTATCVTNRRLRMERDCGKVNRGNKNILFEFSNDYINNLISVKLLRDINISLSIFPEMNFCR